MARYAEGTDVSADRSRSEIDRILTRYGAREIGIAYNDAQIMVAFSMRGRHVKVQVPVTSPEDRRITLDRAGNRKMDAQIAAAHRNEVKRIWRVVVLLLKSKLELVESEAASFDAEFMPYIALPDGSTVGQHVETAIVETYRTGQMPDSLLPALPTPKVIALPARSEGRR